MKRYLLSALATILAILVMALATGCASSKSAWDHVTPWLTEYEKELKEFLAIDKAVTNTTEETVVEVGGNSLGGVPAKNLTYLHGSASPSTSMGFPG